MARASSFEYYIIILEDNINVAKVIGPRPWGEELVKEYQKTKHSTKGFRDVVLTERIILIDASDSM